MSELNEGDIEVKHHNIGLGIAFTVALGIAAPVLAQQAVQWRVEDGGNGHWYQLLLTGPISWNDARARTESHGGYLATPTGFAENAIVVSLANDQNAWVADPYGNLGGPWLGGFQSANGSPASAWEWVTGEPWEWAGWAAGEPNNGFQPGILVTCLLGYAPSHQNYRGWADAFATGVSPNDPTPYPMMVSCIIEWSADCNADGIVDYGQILQGQLVDADSNGVPDICEVDPCPGDVVESGSVNGIDLAAILANWGTDGGKFPRSDANGDGTVDANDLAIVLGGWGSCPD